MWLLLILGGGVILALSRMSSVNQIGGTSLLSSQVSSPVSVPVFPPIGPDSDPRTWYQGNKPGTVLLGGQPLQPGKSSPSTVRTVLGIGSVDQALQGAAIAMQFVPVFGQIGGAIIAVGESIKHMLSAHHQAALATEGKTLNDVEPKMLDAMVLVLLGVLQGQITTAAEAKNNLDQIVADYYVQVKSIQRGMWHYTGKKMALDYATVWNHGVNSRDPSPDAHPPDPCNAACLVGHFFAERNSMLVQAVVINALAGKHGELVLPQIPAHATQAGFPEISVFY